MLAQPSLESGFFASRTCACAFARAPVSIPVAISISVPVSTRVVIVLDIGRLRVRSRLLLLVIRLRLWLSHGLCLRHLRGRLLGGGLRLSDGGLEHCGVVVEGTFEKEVGRVLLVFVAR